MPVAHRMTAREFIDMPMPDFGRPWNLVDGEVIVNEARRSHEAVQSDLYFAISSWAREEAGRGLCTLPLDVEIDARNVFVPDVLWYSEEKAPARGDDPPYPMPDIAVEVRSPSTWRYDIGAKKAGYERHGLPELWLVDTAAEEVLVFKRSTSKAPSFDVALELTCEDTIISPLLPGFAFSVTELFPEPS
ncbi:MAG: Uma2 family endonuclease [Thermoleophilaceae bacterium]|nr:Uma2 family endonuclease [Thermoleophilaceae bacterium]